MSRMVKASDLVLGDYVRDPRSRGRVLKVEEIGTQVFARGLTKETSKYHMFFNRDSMVELATDPTTEDLA